MKYIITILLTIFTSNIFSQNILSLSNNENREKTELIKDIANLLTSKYDTINNLSWSNLKSKEVLDQLKKFQRDIVNSENEIDYYIENNVGKLGQISYSIHFYIKENEDQHSKIYFLFKNNLSTRVDDLLIDDKDIIDAMKKEWHDSMGDDIPPPPLPPSSKKRKG
jgi:uncharacterized membrane protein